jgi:hypothetical protein
MGVVGMRCRCFLDDDTAAGGHKICEGTLFGDGLDGEQVVLEGIRKDSMLTKREVVVRNYRR